MIKNLRLINFQSHKDSELEFDKGMNVIIGPSDSGKTAIIRAFRWLNWNRPGGDDFRSRWGGDTSVAVHVESDNISRGKSNTDNFYSKNKTTFKAFGTEVPEEIQKALRMDDINLQQQMDAPFLLSETSGTVATHFNTIAKLDKIDRGLSYVQKQIKTLGQDIAYLEADKKEKQEALKEYDTLEAFEEALESLESLETGKTEKETDSKRLTGAALRLTVISRNLEKLAKSLHTEQKVDTLLALYAAKKEAIVKYESIKSAALSLFYKQRDILKAEKKVLAEWGIAKVLALYENLLKSQTTLKSLSKLYQTISLIQETAENKRISLEILENKYKADFPEICPLCNTKIK